MDNNRLVKTLVVLAALATVDLGCAPPSPYTEQEQAAIAASLRQQGERAGQQVEEACRKAREVAGPVPQTTLEDGAPGSGVFPRIASGCFAGDTRWYTSPFTGDGLRIYDQGVYVKAATGFTAQEVFEGKFLFLANRPDAVGRGTYVMVGRRTRADGRKEVGIFVAEQVSSYLDLIPADKPYLDRIEKKHKRQVMAFREEQRRRAQSESSSFSFGQALALGLGGAVIASSDIPPEQMIEIGAAMTADVLTDGEAGALEDLNARYAADLERSRAKYRAEMRRRAQEREQARVQAREAQAAEVEQRRQAYEQERQERERQQWQAELDRDQAASRARGAQKRQQQQERLERFQQEQARLQNSQRTTVLPNSRAQVYRRQEAKPRENLDRGRSTAGEVGRQCPTGYVYVGECPPGKTCAWGGKCMKQDTGPKLTKRNEPAPSSYGQPAGGGGEDNFDRNFREHDEAKERMRENNKRDRDRQACLAGCPNIVEECGARPGHTGRNIGDEPNKTIVETFRVTTSGDSGMPYVPDTAIDLARTGAKNDAYDACRDGGGRLPTNAQPVQPGYIRCNRATADGQKKCFVEQVTWVCEKKRRNPAWDEWKAQKKEVDRKQTEADDAVERHERCVARTKADHQSCRERCQR